MSVKKGEKIDQSQIPTASKDKHAFRFWAKRGETTAFDFNTVITDNLELIAIYQADTFTITYEGLKDSETHNNRTSYSSDTPTFTLQKPAFNREGYEFDSWLDEEGQPISSINKGSTGNRVITATFKVINYSITYQGLEGATTTNRTSYNVETETFTLSNPTTREGYTFTGWEDRGLKITTINKGTTGNIVLKATWSADAYSITYENVQGAINPNPVSYKSDDLPFALLPAEKEGYNFLRWEEGGVEISLINPSTDTGNKTITAVFEPIMYPIIYQGLNGSDNVNTLEYSIEDEIDLLPPSNIPSGFTFTGWTLNGKKITKIEIGTTGILTLVATFDVDSYSITYEGLEGATNTNPTSYKADSETIQLANPGSRAGYTFTGWTLGGNKVTSIPAGTTGDLTLTATWDADAYSITYLGVEGAINPNPVSYKTGESVAFNSPTKKGYNFVKWLDQDDQEVTSIDSAKTGDVTLKAIWNVQSYEIVYDGLEGTTNPNPTSYTIESETITLNPLTGRNGYTFKEWIDINTGAKVTEITKGTTVDLTLIATWELVEYNITYKGIDGLNNYNNPKTYNYESAIIFKAPAEKDGYIFAGWLGSDGQPVAYINPLTITGDLVLTADWQPRVYIITYEGVEDSFTTNLSNYTIETETITLTSPTERNGYTFIGWVDEKNQPITEIKNGSTGDRVITAKWTPVSYTITYNGLEGVTHSNPTSYTIETDTITLQNPSERDGYKFTGWEDSDRQKVTEITKGSTGNKVFTATWRDVKIYTITYEIDEKNDITGDDWIDRTLEYTEDDAITLPTISNPNLKFKGWKIRTNGATVGEAYNGQIAAGTFTGDIVLVPYYVATVTFTTDDSSLYIYNVLKVLGDKVLVNEKKLYYLEFEIGA
ncbi:MAG: InlB B-repeat-containing protein, partial [Candidatus Enterosoma sp.]|nr:InlB B-repeat-containing protein [Candidatus Enterosoma sp.]